MDSQDTSMTMATTSSSCDERLGNTSIQVFLIAAIPGLGLSLGVDALQAPARLTGREEPNSTRFNIHGSK